MTNYQFDFSKLTIGDIAAVTQRGATMGDYLSFADKVIVGGISNLPAAQATGLLQLVAMRFAAWLQEGADRDQQEQNARLNDMLDGVEGL